MNTIARIKENRQKITAVVNELKGLPQVECPVAHRFAPGCYLREIFMPKGSIVIGKIHSTEHFNVILSGTVTVITANDAGDFDRETFTAPKTFVSGAGVQKCVVMHTDCVWQTIHVTDKTDIDEIEDEIIAKSYNELKTDSLIEQAKRLAV